MNKQPRYTGAAIALHWLTVPVLLIGFGLGLYMTELPNGIYKLKLYNWHKWAGASFLALSLLRLAWRARNPPPPAPPGPAWQVRVAALVHGAMYLMFFVVPLLGWAYSSALGYPLVWFGIVPLPDWVPLDRTLARAIKPWHERAAWLLAALVLLHLAAVVQHQWLKRDGLLRRMAPWLR
jgi:cytochrome b561